MLSARFITGSAGRLFTVVRRPEGSAECPAILVVPAFGDEMNKTRRMVTETAKRLNAAGIAAVVPDLFGTGDSEGEFCDATWEQWCDDLRGTRDWATADGMRIVGLLGIRAGALLAAEFASKSPPLIGTVMWQPVASGRSFINQMLRIRVVASSVNMGLRETTEMLMQQIESGTAVRVGGYDLTRAVVTPLSGMTLEKSASAALGELHVVETKRTEASCGSANIRVGAVEATSLAVIGEPYWSATETVCDERVVSSTVLHLVRCCADA